MSVSNQITKTSTGIPGVAVAILLGVLAFGIFIVGFDQGEVLGFTVPADGSEGGSGTNWAHEFYHDMRHAAGFPCH
ncbi:MAG: CbtB-domain containing protein [Thermoproteota archaeon]|jgi:hypothetical protein|nr:CbtB-domain containing protein [Thermoproteota archaeon]